MKKVLIIAEAGVNHNGDIKLAKKLVDIAKNANADIVKFQTWITEDIMDTSAPKAVYQTANDGEGNQYDMAKKLELSFEQFREIKKYCDQKNIIFLSTPDEKKSLNFLVDELKMDLIKVGSGEITNIPFLRDIGRKGKKVILSTGMATMDEVTKAYNTLLQAGAKTVSILHCTSDYPATLDSVNLTAMNSMGKCFETEMGYSDHTLGFEVSIAAVALGAKIIEKHFTIDKNLPGPDHKASLDPDELKTFVQLIRNTEKALEGSGQKAPQPCELAIREVVLKGIYINCDLSPGDILKEEHMLYKRPVGQIPAGEFDRVVNQKVKKSITQGSPLKWDDLDLKS